MSNIQHRTASFRHTSINARSRARWLLPVLAVAIAAACGTSTPTRGSYVVSEALLGTSESFAVLGGSTVTNTGPTTVYGNVGVDPGLAITGFPPGLVTGGAFHNGDGVALQAQTDTVTAYNTLAGQAPTQDLTGQDLGGMTLVPGVYHFSSSAQLTGALSLDAKGDPSAVFVFQIGSTLTTASNSSVLMLNGAQDCNVFWQVGSSATLGTTTAFKGNILALTSITLDTGATVSGRALARNGAVTMDSNDVSTLLCASSVDAGVDGSVVDATIPDSSVADSSVADSSVADSSGKDTGAADSGGLCCGGVICNASCVDLKADVGNCGSCGNACGSDEFCAVGKCVTCGTVCNGKCADLPTDNANCGSCGNACNKSQSCTNGKCVACAHVCKGVCVDVQSDNTNCGGCGTTCLVSESCNAGKCTACPNLCNGNCTDWDNDANNCGKCGNVCALGESCKSGMCTCQ